MGIQDYFEKELNVVEKTIEEQTFPRGLRLHTTAIISVKKLVHTIKYYLKKRIIMCVESTVQHKGISPVIPRR